MYDEYDNIILTVYIYNFRWKDKKDVHILSTWGDVKYSDVKSRFNEETKRNLHMIIDYNKSMGGVDKLYQFRSYYDVGMDGKKFRRYIFYTYLILLLLIVYLLQKIKINPWVDDF